VGLFTSVVLGNPSVAAPETALPELKGSQIWIEPDWQMRYVLLVTYLPSWKIQQEVAAENNAKEANAGEHLA
jgi:hypothetical protein